MLFRASTLVNMAVNSVQYSEQEHCHVIHPLVVDRKEGLIGSTEMEPTITQQNVLSVSQYQTCLYSKCHEQIWFFWSVSKGQSYCHMSDGLAVTTLQYHTVRSQIGV